MNTTGFSCPWDSGQVGFIYCTHKQLKDDGIPVEQAKQILLGEVETYDQFLRGDIYGFVITAKCEKCGQEKDDPEDSCWGFYGDNIFENGMSDHFSKEDATFLANGSIEASADK